MKKKIIPITIIAVCMIGVLFYNSQSENGLLDDLKYVILPDPMKANTYDNGECTAYVFDLIKNDQNMIEKSWGDAENWAKEAKKDGYTVDDVPTMGSILQTTDGPIGHVAYVTKVSKNSVIITEMNLKETYKVTEREIKKEDLKHYKFIHPKNNPRPKSDKVTQLGY